LAGRRACTPERGSLAGLLHFVRNIASLWRLICDIHGIELRQKIFFSGPPGFSLIKVLPLYGAVQARCPSIQGYS